MPVTCVHIHTGGYGFEAVSMVDCGMGVVHCDPRTCNWISAGGITGNGRSLYLCAAYRNIYYDRVGCLLVLMATTWFQVRYWANSVTLFERALAVTENNYVLHSNLGVTLFSKGKVDEAIGHFHDAMRINPRYAKAHNNLGTALIHKGKVKKAIAHFREALRIRPGYSDAHDNLQKAISLVEK
jgi:tetratricopeptide (TPR) repeat protein